MQNTDGASVALPWCRNASGADPDSMLVQRQTHLWQTVAACAGTNTSKAQAITQNTSKHKCDTDRNGHDRTTYQRGVTKLKQNINDKNREQQKQKTNQTKQQQKQKKLETKKA